MKWNPAEVRYAYSRNDCSLIRAYIEAEFDPNGAMGNRAIGNLRTAIKSWLCGLDEKIAPIFPTTLAWLDYAIEKDDDRGPAPFPLARLYEAKAMCNWMARSQSDAESWKAAMVHYSSKLVDGKPPPGWLPKDYIEMFLPACIFAGEYARGLAEFERFFGAKKLALSKVWRPREFAYALCLHHIRGEFGKDELFEAGKKMLRSYVDTEWLYNGAYMEAAIWLKVVYSFGAPGLTPMQILLSLYDVMGEPMPDFIEENTC